MDHCSRITIGHNTKIVLQHNLPTSLLPYNTIFQLPSLAIHSCILQYNFHVVCFPIILQYNVAIQFPPSLAIQSLAITQPRLQYNFVLQLNLDYSCNTIQATQAFFSTIQKLYCNTMPLQPHPLVSQYNAFLAIQFHYYFFQPSLLQYNCKACNTIFFFFTIQPILEQNFFFHYNFFSQLFSLETQNFIYIFFSPIHPINL